MAAVAVEFMDGEKRRYEVQGDDGYTEVKDGVLRVYSRSYYGAPAMTVASLPIANIREYRWEGR